VENDDAEEKEDEEEEEEEGDPTRENRFVEAALPHFLPRITRFLSQRRESAIPLACFAGLEQGFDRSSRRSKM